MLNAVQVEEQNMVTEISGERMQQKRKNDLFPYFMCLPALLLFLLFVLLPFCDGLWTSFHLWDGFSDMKWTGLKNYKFVLKDAIFWKAMGNTFIYAVFVTIIKNVIALALAFVLVKNFWGRTIFRTGIYLPVTLSYVVIGVLWVWVYNPTFGLLNAGLRAIGQEYLIKGWLSDPNVALFSVMTVDIWKWIGYHMVLYIAGLQAISKDLYEAGDLDGANGFQQLIHITIPQLNSTIVVNVLMSLTGAFVSNFDIVNIMTGGGPMHSTEVTLTYIVTTAFKYSAMGKANAMSMILFIFVLFFGFMQIKLMTKEGAYD
jgi:raffinose/stachyose/melibiose transport system permease protein